MKILKKNDEILSEIKRLFKSASKIKCAVAFWGKGASDLFSNSKAKSIEIVCNLMSGGTNPDEIKTIIGDIKKNGEVRMDNSLHAKVFWTDKGMIIGSANASANGLSLEETEIKGWKEMSVLIEDQKLIKEVEKWFDGTFKSSKEIDNKILEESKEIWKKQKATRPNLCGGISFYDALKNGFYSGKNIYILIDSEFMDEEEQNNGEKLVKEMKKEHPSLNASEINYWNRCEKNFNRDVLALCFGEEEKLPYKFTGLYRILPQKNDKKIKGIIYQFGEKIKENKIGLTPTHKNELKKIVKKYIQTENPEKQQMFPIEDLAKLFKKATN